MCSKQTSKQTMQAQRLNHLPSFVLLQFPHCLSSFTFVGKTNKETKPNKQEHRKTRALGAHPQTEASVKSKREQTTIKQNTKLATTASLSLAFGTD